MKKIKSVFVVDDDPDLVEAVRACVTLEGWDCVSATSQNEALAKLRNQEFMCILLDMNLGKNGKGEDLLEQIRTHESLNNIKTPVVIISGTLDGERIKSVYRNVSSILMKPFSLSGLIEKIEHSCK